MNLYELGKDVQTLLTVASSIDSQLSEVAFPSTSADPAGTLATNFPCVPRPVYDDFDNNAFRAALHGFTIISNTARGDDYVVAAVSNVELHDIAGNGLGASLYLVRNTLQSMAALAGSLTDALGEQQGSVDILYGTYDYRRGPNPPGIIPVLYGLRAEWTPNAADFGKAGDGLLISLAAKLVQSGGSCGLWIRAKTQQAFDGPITEFRAGSSYTKEKLDALAAGYHRARVQKKGFNALGLSGDVLVRVQLQ